MKKYIFLIITLFVAVAGDAQVVTDNASTVQNQTLKVREGEMKSTDIDLHLSGASKVEMKIADNTSWELFSDFSYTVTIHVKNGDVVKSTKTLTYSRDNFLFWGSEKWSNGMNSVSGNVCNATLEVSDGASGDCITFELGGLDRRWGVKTP